MEKLLKTDIFKKLSIWKEEKYRKLQGTYPVMSLSFANVKEINYKSMKKRICQLLTGEYARCRFLLKGDCLSRQEKDIFQSKTGDMDEAEAAIAINQLYI